MREGHALTSSGQTTGGSIRPGPLRRAVDLIVDTLLELGVSTFYGIPGAAISPVYDALLEHPEARVITARHETGAAFMAMGHARMSGGPVCLLMTSGPGITNAVTGLAAAAAEGLPLIAIGGEVPRSRFGHGALQEGSSYQLNILGAIRPPWPCVFDTAPRRGHCPGCARAHHHARANEL